MLLNFNFINNCSLQSTQKVNNCRNIYSNKINFGGNIDTFEKTPLSETRKKELLHIISGDFRNITKDFLDKLSKEEYQYCLEWAKSDEDTFGKSVLHSSKSVLPEDVKDIISFSDFYYRGLQRIANKHGKDMTQILLTSIGQSPTSTVQALGLIGVPTAFCPISGLTTFNEPVQKYVTKENVDKYFSYWKTFGFDINDLFGDKLIVFTDHEETGQTFKTFKKIIKEIIKIKKPEMEKMGKKVADIKFLSLKKIFENSYKTITDENWGNDYSEKVFHTSYMKTLYSPLFKLPLPKISQIKEIHQSEKGSARNIRFNKLSILLYHELSNPIKHLPKRTLSTIEREREYRLSYYKPEEDTDDWYEDCY